MTSSELEHSLHWSALVPGGGRRLSSPLVTSSTIELFGRITSTWKEAQRVIHHRHCKGCETPDWVWQPWYASGGALPSCGQYNSWKASWEACEWIRKEIKGLSTKPLNVTDKDFCLMHCCNDGTIMEIVHQTQKIILSLCWSLSRHKHQCLCLENSIGKKLRICKVEICWNVKQKQQHGFWPLNDTWTTSFRHLFSCNPLPWFTNQSSMGHKIPDKTHKKCPTQSGF